MENFSLWFTPTVVIGGFTLLWRHLDKRLDDMNKRIDDVNRRVDDTREETRNALAEMREDIREINGDLKRLLHQAPPPPVS